MLPASATAIELLSGELPLDVEELRVQLDQIGTAVGAILKAISQDLGQVLLHLT